MGLAGLTLFDSFLCVSIFSYELDKIVKPTILVGPKFESEIIIF